MATKRKREIEDDSVSNPASKQQKQDEVTRSGRVRKKPAKFVEDTAEDVEAKADLLKSARSPPVARTQSVPGLPTSPISHNQSVPGPQTLAVPHTALTPPTNIIVVPVNPEVQTPGKEDVLSGDEDSGKTSCRSSRARKKSAKVLEMEEFEEAEKKHVKKDPTKKSKSPVAQNNMEEIHVESATTTNMPIPILKIKDIPTTPKIEAVSPVNVQASPQKSPVAGTSKSPIALIGVSAKSPDSKASVIKLLLSSPTQSAKPALTTSSVAQTPPISETKPNNKKAKGKSKSAAKQLSPSNEKTSKIRQALEMTQPVASTVSANLSLKQRLDQTVIKSEPVEPVVDRIKTEELEEITAVPVPMITKETKSKRGSKKVVDADESPFLPPPAPSPNVIHVGPMNIGLEVKHEAEYKKKKGKVKPEPDIEEEMIHEDFGLDMSEIELGDAGNDSFMEIEEDDGLMIPEEEVVTTEKAKVGKEGKKKTMKGKKKIVSLQLGDIPNTDGELVMDFARMKNDEKKKKKDKTPKEDAEISKKKRAPTAYMLWCSSNRPRLVDENPGIDFSTISKTLGEMWSTLSDKDKMIWKRKAKKAAGKGSTLITTGKTGAPKVPGSQTVTTARQMAVISQKSNPALAQALLAAKLVKSQPVDDISSPIKGFGIEPVDVAAHLKIVGESLSIIGMKLQEHRIIVCYIRGAAERPFLVPIFSGDWRNPKYLN